MSPTPGIVTDETELADFVRDRGPHCLIVARHGETDWNAEGRLQGQQDIALNSRGRIQALAAARFLRSIPLQQVHSSNLRRCQETAGSVAATGQPGGAAAPAPASSTSLLRVESVLWIGPVGASSCRDHAVYPFRDDDSRLLKDVEAR